MRATPRAIGGIPRSWGRPVRSAADPSEPLLALYDLLLRDVRVAGVCRVLSYTVDPPTADVTLLARDVRMVDGDDVPQPVVSVPGCPVLWPGGGGRLLAMGLEAGDLALAVYRHRSHDEIDSGATSPLVPASGRRLNPADLIILPGFIAPGATADDRARTDGQPSLVMPTGEALHLGAAAAALRLVVAEVLAPYLAALELYLSLHVHDSAGTPPTTPPPAAPSAGDLASARVKVDA